ncbi:MAG: DUF5916 domain-containing protein [Candidatus Aminicenantales bacterium]
MKSGKSMILAGIILSVMIGPRTFLSGQTAPAAPDKRVCRAARVAAQAPVIDGRMDEEAWSAAEEQSGFIQNVPYEGEEPTEQTSFRILYDDRYLYVGIRAFDSEAGTIQRRLSRRDDIDGDLVAVEIDSYHDHLTCFAFGVNAAGVRADEIWSNDSSSGDESWDPLWEARTSVDAKGWTAEMRIPFTQIRFAGGTEQIWGLQVARGLFRKKEGSLWQFIPKNAPGWTSQFGELRGISGIKPPRQVEIVPYTVGRMKAYERQPGNPFAPGREKVLLGGLDGKIGITHDLTMDFTVNPDFGQVEADPSVINLSAYEIWFEEKRPFFVEGRNIFNFQIMGGDGDFSSDNLFYSRRIGRSPQAYPAGPGFVDQPGASTILGAFKLSGKTRNGLSIGIMDSLTSREHASIFDNGAYASEAVEPLTNFFVARLQKDFRRGATTIGGMFTAVNRSIRDEGLDFLHRSAYTGGVDAVHTWKNKDYFVSLNTVFSLVRGSAEALARTQQSSAHYFQRPDAGHLSFDPGRTSLSGHGGTLAIGKQGGGNLVFSTGATWRSPGLDLNDLGFLRFSDRIMEWVWAGYRINKPFSVFRSVNLNFNQWMCWNFDGVRLYEGGNVNGWLGFKNYWSANFGLNRNGSGLSDGTLRGGPALRYPASWNWWAGLNSDSRKKVTLGIGGSETARENGESNYWNVWSSLSVIPGPGFNFSINPGYSWNHNEMQYVETCSSGGETRWLTGRIDQKTLSLTFRMNLSLAPDLTLQFYGMPFLSTGKYSRFKDVVNPGSRDYDARYELIGEDRLAYEAADDRYSVDENSDGIADYGFDNPDFSFLQFRMNVVARWEFRPGCTAYLVWSQGRTSEFGDGIFEFGKDWSRLFDAHPENVFLIKFSYAFTL